VRPESAAPAHPKSGRVRFPDGRQPRRFSSLAFQGRDDAVRQRLLDTDLVLQVAAELVERGIVGR